MIDESTNVGVTYHVVVFATFVEENNTYSYFFWSYLKTLVVKELHKLFMIIC